MIVSASSLRKRLGEETAAAIYGAEVLSETLITEDIASAEGEVLGFAAVRYALPLEGETAIAAVRGWILTLAEDLAWGRASSTPPPESLKIRVANVRDLLMRVADGTLKLVGTPENRSASVTLTHAQKPLFTRETLGGF